VTSKKVPAPFSNEVTLEGSFLRCCGVAAPGVDEERPLLHESKCRRIDHVLGVSVERAVEGDHV
jgi:hypothetical protein